MPTWRFVIGGVEVRLRYLADNDENGDAEVGVVIDALVKSTLGGIAVQLNP